MSNCLRADVVVVGLGPAGACAAAAAAARGASVISVDRKQIAGVPLQCAEFVPGPLYSQIANLKAATRQAISAMTTLIEAAQPYHSPDFRGAMIDRICFDQMLVEEAQRVGARIIPGVKVAAIEASGLHLIDGRLLKARVIVGADGPRSLVGRAIRQVNRELVDTRQVTVPLSGPSRTTDIFLSGAYRGGYAWLFPKGDRAHIGVGVIPCERRRLKPLLHQLHMSLVEQKRVGREIFNLTGGAIPVGGMLQPIGEVQGHAVLLAGDAAGLTHPITGAGIAAAVLSGRMAGQAAAAFVDGESQACSAYAEDLQDVFAGALHRAVVRRRELLSASRLDVETMRRSWIAFPEYWESAVAAPSYENGSCCA